jgi:hypothetical protein
MIIIHGMDAAGVLHAGSTPAWLAPDVLAAR